MNEQGTALATRSSMLPSPDDWQMLRALAESLVKSGFLPKAINTPEKAIAVMEKGRELNIKPMYALSNIAVIDGKPMAGAELMLALMYRDHGDDALRVIESTPERCTAVYRRRGWKEGEQFSFTVEDAKRAGLTGKDNWRNYPAAMLRARCISAIARLAFPDTIGGLYTPEELGAEETIDDTGDVVIVQQVATHPASEPERQQAKPEPHPLAAVLGERVKTLTETTGETKEGIVSRVCDIEGLRRNGRIDFSRFTEDDYRRVITRVEREIESVRAETSEADADVAQALPF